MSCSYCLEHLAELVVKEVHGAGGYGMLVGPAASRPSATRFAPASSPPRKVHRPTYACAVHLSDVHRVGPRAEAYRSATLRIVRQDRAIWLPGA